MKQRILKFIVGGLLVGSVLLTIMFARSGYVDDYVEIGNSKYRFMIRSDWGRLCFEFVRGNAMQPISSWQTTDGGYHGMLRCQSPIKVRGALGVRIVDGLPMGFSNGGSYRWVRIYYLHVLPIMLFIPAIMGYRWLASYMQLRQRRAAGLCTTCGYDLRATPNRCPECGSTRETVPSIEHVK